MASLNIGKSELAYVRSFSGYWYLASPYTHYPRGREAAFRIISDVASWLMVRDVVVFCPIAHSHPICEHGEIGDLGLDFDFWMKMDGSLMDRATGLIVTMLNSWNTSRGVLEEIRRFSNAGKPIFYVRNEID